MNSKIAITLLFVFATGSLGASLLLSSRLTALEAEQTDQVLRFRDVSDKLLGEKVRLENKDRALKDVGKLANTIRTAQRIPTSAAEELESSQDEATDDTSEDLLEQMRRFYVNLVAAGITEKPDLASMPLLTDEERAEFDEKRRLLSQLPRGPLKTGGVDAVLRDPNWNPRGRDLSKEERECLKRLLDYDGDGKRDLAFGVWTGVKKQVHVIFGRGQGAAEFTRGDVNADARVDLADAIAILDFLFGGGRVLRCAKAADANDDGAVQITDAVFLLGHLFSGTATPPEPYPARGLDPTPDGLPCRAP